MSDLENASLLLSAGYELIRFSDLNGYRLLNEDILARLETIAGNLIMSCRGCNDANCINVIDDFFVVGVCRSPVLFCYRPCFFLDDIDNSNKFRILELRVDPCMVLSKVSNSDHAYFNCHTSSLPFFRESC